jgi:hypothetical protein
VRWDRSGRAANARGATALKTPDLDVPGYGLTVPQTLQTQTGRRTGGCRGAGAGAGAGVAWGAGAGAGAGVDLAQGLLGGGGHESVVK